MAVNKHTMQVADSPAYVGTCHRQLRSTHNLLVHIYNVSSHSTTIYCNIHLCQKASDVGSALTVAVLTTSC